MCLGKDPARLSGCESNPEPIAIHEFIRMRIHIPQGDCHLVRNSRIIIAHIKLRRDGLKPVATQLSDKT